MTIRTNTERPITINQGTNQLIKLTKDSIGQAAKEFFKNNDWKPSKIRYWYGNAAKRIVETLIAILGLGKI